MTQIQKIIFVCLSFIVGVMAPHISNAQEEPKTVTYVDGQTTLEGHWEPSHCFGGQPMPVVLIIPQWKGITDHEKQVASKVAELCFNAFVIDMYGQGVRPKTIDEAKAQSTKYKEAPELALSRMKAAIAFAKTQKFVDTSRFAAMGYCFGGTMALDLARANIDPAVKGVVSFHGGLTSNRTAAGDIKSSILVHHGADDPFVPPADVSAFMTEMKTAKADYVFSQYSGAVHSFTQNGIEADKIDGAAYNEKADLRSWDATAEFLMATLSRL